ncbi:hypothetical protein DFH29DRAFT_256570 [Suillus ampliporus]|nr:hypothetical protein DFH29DRAFT_256570 [Suillus ampliporus]
MDSNGTDCVLIFVALIFPPAAAAFISGCGCDLIVNILLTLLGYFPGLIHALWLIFKRANVQERRGAGNYRCEYLKILRVSCITRPCRHWHHGSICSAASAKCPSADWIWGYGKI